MKSYFVESLVRLLYPANCEICRKPIGLKENILCASCRESLLSLAWPPETAFVDRPFEYLDHVWTVFAYESPLRELLHAVKYHRKDYLLGSFRQPVAALAQMITADIPYHALVPIPIDREKYMERHFNQAEILAKMVGRWGSPVPRKNLLAKSFHILSQASLNHTEREINVYGAFKLTNRGKVTVQGRSFLLIDDVLTTGSTANEAARILKKAGAKRVDLFALARTMTADDKNSLRFPTATANIGSSL